MIPFLQHDAFVSYFVLFCRDGNLGCVYIYICILYTDFLLQVGYCVLSNLAIWFILLSWTHFKSYPPFGGCFPLSLFFIRGFPEEELTKRNRHLIIDWVSMSQFLAALCRYTQSQALIWRIYIYINLNIYIYIQTCILIYIYTVYTCTRLVSVPLMISSEYHCVLLIDDLLYRLGKNFGWASSNPRKP